VSIRQQKEQKDELSALLRPIRRRLSVQKLVLRLTAGVLWGLGGSLMVLLIARLVPIPYYKAIAAAICLLAVAAGAIVAFIHRPDERECALLADRQGLAQRVVTALEHRESTSPLAVMQREDAVRRLREALPQVLESIPVLPDAKRPAYAAGCLLSLCLLLVFWANPQDERLAQLAQEREAKKAAQEAVTKLEQEAKAAEGLSDAQKKKLEEILAQAKKALSEADSQTERLQALKAAEKQLDQWKQAELAKQAALQRLQQSLAQHQGLRQAAASLSKEDRQALVEALRQSAKALEALSAKERQSLAEELQKAAEHLAQAAADAGTDDAAATAAQLKQAAEQLAQGNVQSAMASLQSGLLQAMQQVTQAQQGALLAAQSLAALQQSQMMLAAAGSPSGSAGQTGMGFGAGTAGSVGAGTAVPASGSAGANSSGAGSQQGQGTSPAGSAGGNGQAGGGSGSGAGNGSGNGAGSGSGAGVGGGSGKGGGKGPGAGLGAGRHELVTVPSPRIGAEGPTDTVGGPLGAGPSQSRASTTTQVSSGAARPYEEVYSQYASFVRESLEHGKIPDDYQDAVKAYFSSIEP
jgi:hypothetical protein